jgi:hypothetical protein
MRHDIPIPRSTVPKAKANPSQIKTYDDVSGRKDLLTMLNHLSPARRIQFHEWVCSQAILPGTHGLHPGINKSTRRYAKIARHCDKANEILTADIIIDLTTMSTNYDLDLDKVIARLELMAKQKSF